jgi:hypothetical protein
MRCDDLAEVLPGIVDGSTSLDRGARRHVAACLRCQAELVQYRKLVRGLRTLQTQVVPVPGLLADIVRAVESGELTARASASVARRAAYLSGLAAATAAGAAGAIVLATRARSRRLAG